MDYNRLNGPQRKILREALKGVFPDRSTFRIFLADNDFSALDDVAAPGGYETQLFEYIRAQAAIGVFDAMMKQVIADYPVSPAVIDLPIQLTLVDQPSNSQRVAPAHGGLERAVRDSGFNDLYLWTNNLVSFGRRICRIRYRGDANTGYGTGFLIGPNRVLTNYHVIEPMLVDGAESDRLQIKFDYAEQHDDLAPGVNYGVAENWLLHHSKYSEADLTVDGGLPNVTELDYAVIRLAHTAGDFTLADGQIRGWVDLSEVSAPPDENDILFVLQHPDGKPLKQSIGVSRESPSAVRVRYDADTEHGSSGSLVLNAQLKPVGLHHAGDPDSKIKARFNQGIPLQAIAKAIESAGV